jgi:hypothetical protein
VRDQLRGQLADARMALSLRPVTSLGRPWASVSRVDALMPGLDGTDIEIVLHVVDGYVRDLEAYRVNGGPIERGGLDEPVKQINRYPLSFDRPRASPDRRSRP